MQRLSQSCTPLPESAGLGVNAKRGSIIANKWRGGRFAPPDYIVMKTTQVFLTSFLSLTLVHGIHAAPADADHVTVSAYNTLTYSPSTIVVHPGQ